MSFAGAFLLFVKEFDVKLIGPIVAGTWIGSALWLRIDYRHWVFFQSWHDVANADGTIPHTAMALMFGGLAMLMCSSAVVWSHIQ